MSARIRVLGLVIAAASAGVAVGFSMANHHPATASQRRADARVIAETACDMWRQAAEGVQ